MPLDDAVKKEIEAAFDLYDSEGAGTMTGAMFAEACKGLGLICGFPSKDECADIVEKMPSVDKATFCKEMEKRALVAKCLKEGEFYFWTNGNPFQVLDKDNSGSISGEELQKVMCSLGNKMSTAEYEEMFDLVGGTNPGAGACDYKDLYAKVQSALTAQ